MRIKSIGFLLLLSSSCFGQNLNFENKVSPGTYTSLNESHNNRYHYEALTINKDHSFVYKAYMGEFIKIEKSGNWKIECDTLILNEQKPAYPQVMLVTEQFDESKPKDVVCFQVKYYNGEDFRFTVSGSNGDTTLILRNKIHQAILLLKKIEEFSISSTSFEYPKFVVKNPKANSFIVKLAHSRLFIDEKWLIEGVKIRPRGTNGQSAGYYLSRRL